MTQGLRGNQQWTFMSVRVTEAQAEFSDWDGLMRLLHSAFVSQADRIDPPSSLHRLDAGSIAVKAREERLFLAFKDEQLVGCIFAKSLGSTMYVGKLAVSPAMQGQGIGRALVSAVAATARQTNHDAVQLDVRIELTENHATFAALGFVKIGEHAHAGYDRSTFCTMKKTLT